MTMDYKDKYEEAKRLYQTANADQKYVLESLFPELKESEEDKTKRILQSISSKISFHLHDIFTEEEFQCFDAWSNAWLEKQGEQSIFNVPIREIILAIWDLGNEWKELTNGCISTEYGTQLDYIQKHWQESEYYLKAKQGERKFFDYENANIQQKDFAEQKPTWSEKDKKYLRRAINATRNGYPETNNWLKSLKDRVQPKQEWNEEDKRKINRIYSILGQAADTHAFSTTCRLISDKECVELQDFLKSLKERIGG